MTLTIHWSKCDAPHTERIEGVQWVQADMLGLRYFSAKNQMIDVKDIDLADGWAVRHDFS